MSRSIDTRVVEMQFKNAQFESGVKNTMTWLDKLKSALGFKGATKGLDDISNAANKFSMEGMAQSVNRVADSFGILGVIGRTAIAKLTSQAIDLGQKTVAALVDPIVEGGQKRALNIEQARFQFKGLGMDVEASMASALAAVEGTAYGLDEAAVVAAQFGASGMEAGDQMTNALRGISGVAAMAGSSYSDIGNVFTKVAGQGRLMGDDLNRLATRGVNAAATLAESMGITEQEVRKMVTKGEIDFQTFADAMNDAFGEHATKANETYTGSLSNMRAALARIGATYFTKHFETMRKFFNQITPQIDAAHEALKPFIDLLAENHASKMANFGNAIEAINFEYIGQIIERVVAIIRNLRDAVTAFLAPIGEAFSQVFGNEVDEGVSRIIPLLDKIVEFTSKLTMSGETAEKVKNIFVGFFSLFELGFGIIGLVIGTVFSLFGDLFGLFTGFGGSGGGGVVSSFLDIASSAGLLISGFSKMLQTSGALQNFFENIRNSVSGLFDGIAEALPKFVSGIRDLFSGDYDAFGAKIASGFDSIFSKFADASPWVDKVVGWLADAGEEVSRFLGRFNSGVLAPVGQFFTDLANRISEFRSDVQGRGAKAADLTRSVVNVENMETAARRIGKVFGVIRGALEATARFVGPIVGRIIDTIGTVSSKFLDYVKDLDTAELIALINTGFFIALYTTMRGFVGSLKEMVEGTSGIFSGVTDVLDGITGSLKTMQAGVRAKIILTIAIAIGVLAASAALLAMIDTDKLLIALTAMTVMMTQLMISLKIFSKFETDIGKMLGLAAGLVLLSFAVGIMSSALIRMADLSWEEIAKGLVAVGGLLGAMAIFTKLAELGGSGGAIKHATALVILAGAIYALSFAVEKFGKMDVGVLLKGIGAVSVLLGSLSILAHMMKNSNMLSGAAGILILSVALVALEYAIRRYDKLEWLTFIDGMGKLAIMIGVIGVAMNLMPKDMPAKTFGLLILAGALIVLAEALNVMGQMGWDEIAKALTILAVGLGVMAVAMILMTGTAAGSAALVILVAALTLFIPVLFTLGSMPWEVIAIGLGAMAGALLILIAAGAGAQVFAIGLAVLAGAILAIGIAVLIAGAGIALFGIGFGIFVGAIVAGFAVLTAAFQALLAVTPLMMEQLKLVMLGMAVVIRDAGPPIISALFVVLHAIMDEVIIATPKIKAMVVILIYAMVDAVVETAPYLLEQGAAMMMDLLTTLDEYLPPIVELAFKLMTDFIKQITDKIPDLVDAGTEMVLTFMEEVAQKLQDEKPRIEAAAEDIGDAIASGIIAGLSGAGSRIATAGRNAAKEAWSAAKRFLGIESPSKLFRALGHDTGEGYALGIDDEQDSIGDSAENLGHAAIFAMKKTISGLSELLDSELDLDPTITPILDLSNVEKNARSLDDMFYLPDFSMSGAYSRARAVERGRQTRDETTTEPVVVEHKEIKFEQHNHSPKALDRVEIYRQTNNQLSLLREEFNVAPS